MGARKKTPVSRKGKLKKLPTVVEVVIGENDYKLYPSAIQLAKKYANKSIAKGIIENKNEKEIYTGALIARAIELADFELVKPEHIESAREEFAISFGPGNCPPHRCARASVLDKVEVLREKMPVFNRMLEILEKQG